MKRVYKIVLVIIIVLGLFFLFSDRLFLGNNPFKQVYKVMIIPVSKLSNSFNDIRNYKSISALNKKLEKDNILLNSTLDKNSALEEENKELKSLMDLSYESQNKVFARVISRNRLYFFDTFIISRGSGSGISLSDAVLCSEGLVGRVISISKNYATVRMITSNYDDNKLSVVIKGKKNVNGVVKEYKDGYLLIDGIDNYNKVLVGDKVYTSGLGLMSRGFYVGKVSKVVLDSYGISNLVYVKPVSSLSNINYVMVVSND